MDTNLNQYSEREKELVLDRGRRDAQWAVIVQFLAALAARSPQDAEMARKALQAADKAALNVRWEDLTIAKTV